MVLVIEVFLTEENEPLNSTVIAVYVADRLAVGYQGICRHTDAGTLMPNIETIFPRFGDSHVKDKTVDETVLSLTWESLYW